MIVWIALGVIAALVLLFIFLPVVAWILVGLVLLVLAVVLLVPIGADVAYIDGEFSLAARIDGFAYQLLPKRPEDPNKPPREKKPKKEKPPKEPKPDAAPKPKRKLSFTREELFELVQKALKGLGKFGKLTVRRFMLHYVAAGEDPYNTAMTYNYVNAALSTLAPVAAQKVHVSGDVDVWTDIDFTADSMRLDAALSVTLRLIQVVHAGLAVAFGALGVLIKNRRRLRREAKLAQKDGPAELESAEADENTTEIEIEITKAEERNDLHG